MALPPDIQKTLNTPVTMVGLLEIFKRQLVNVRAQNNYLLEVATNTPEKFPGEREEAMRDIGALSNRYDQELEVLNQMIGVISLHEITNEVNAEVLNNV
jgi:hypothetical protein